MLCVPAPPFATSGVRPLATSITALRWPSTHRNVSVYYLDGEPAVQAAVTKLVAEYVNRACGVQLVVVPKLPADVRVTFYSDTGWSFLGTDCLSVAPPVPTMALPLTSKSAPNQIRYMAVHEIMHLLGCVHEHQSPLAHIPWNLEVLYEEYGRRGWTKAMVDANIVNPYEPLRVQAGTYDPSSSTHYPVEPRFVTDGVARGSTGYFSEGDVKMLREWYGMPPKLPVREQPAPPLRKVFLPIVRRK